ncbi:hypothetical protein GCM10023321_11360 [Pseudonocardia eucalypti]|uniref:Uncharacterized protein n=1 Tax=Pseudonocardia eucalypti TaxID=648755 RepID=A0ABP9PMV4_9PSEU|nr:chromosome segregation ATPase [Pseudonocardia eucalypti]
MAQTKTDRTAAELARRRNTLRKRQTGAERTGRQVTELDKALERNTVQAGEQEAELRTTLDRVAMLKKTIKAGKKHRDKLRTARKKARDRDADARQRASTAEAKYDKAVMADMVRREKQRDLAQHDPRAGVASVPELTESQPAAALPPAGGDIARETQARKTATRAKPRKPTTTL